MQLVVNENGWNNFSTQTKVEMPVYGNCVYVCGCAYVWISLISKLMMMPMSNLSELNADKIRWIEINEMLLFSHGRWNSVVYRPIVQFVSIETRFGDTIVSFVYDFYELASRGGLLVYSILVCNLFQWFANADHLLSHWIISFLLQKKIWFIVCWCCWCCSNTWLNYKNKNRLCINCP